VTGRSSRDRDDVSRTRDERAETRLETADDRDRAATLRDRGAEGRDDEAQIRELADRRTPAGTSPDADGGSGANAHSDRARSSDDRKRAAGDRASAAADRVEAAHDRTLAAADRHGASEDRARSAAARTKALAEHSDAIRVLVEAASTLAEISADELAAVQRLASIVDGAQDAILSKDLQGTILTWNRSAERVYGYSAGEALGKSVAMLMPPGRPPELPDIFLQFARGEHVAQFETKRLRKDGAVIDISLTISPVFGAEGDLVGATTISRDITIDVALSLKREEQLRRAQKLESIGSLAGGVAHDFNNILTVIRGNAELLLNSPEAEGYRDRVLEIDKAAALAAALTHQLLAFSRQQVLRPDAVDVNEAASAICDLVGPLIGEPIRLERQFRADPAVISIDRAQLQQVVMNLCINARDAMPHGGTVLVRTENAVLDDSFAGTQFELEPGRYVLLEVTDTGLGMSAETVSRIFDPFFTTKPQGTGLGLSTVFGVVKQSLGHVTVYSEPGIGTTFKIYLPQFDGVASDRAPEVANAAPTPVAGGGETILLVEDFEVLRALGAEMLEAAGYSVRVAANGSEALAIFDRHAKDIDVVLTDVMMPQMDGKELAQRLLSKRPDLKIIFTSGYPAQTAIDEQLTSCDVEFIQKPYSSGELTAKIREILSDWH
jgi:two-component system, cell cycle sensor histidine kinase and response regulator CckA